MKKIAITFIALLLSTFAFAQNGSGHRKGKQNFEAQLEQLKTELNLSDQQANQWKEVHVKYSPQMKAIRQDTSLAQEEKRAKTKELRKQKDLEIKAFLTAEQYTQFQSNRKERGTKHRNQNRGTGN